jgi:formamidopyrimidine-DNA glycosylase
MPELAEVELSRRVWAVATGQRVEKISGHPHARVYRDTSLSAAIEALKGLVFIESRTHGKRMFFKFGPTKGRLIQWLEIHLGMAGRLTRDKFKVPKHKHDHFVIETKDWCLNYNDYRQFGRIYLHPIGTDPFEVLPIEILSSKFTHQYVTSICELRGKRAVKAILLDQHYFPGIGNWMADEICWRLGRHPATPLKTFDVGVFRRATRSVCRGSLRHIADANSKYVDNEEEKGFSPGNYVRHTPPINWLFRHRWKAGGCCPNCKSILDRGVVATRTTAWCPSCQPL